MWLKTLFRKSMFTAFTVCMAHASVVMGNSSWIIDEEVDSLTDEKIVTATTSYSRAGENRSVVVRCKGSNLEVYFGFGKFLSNDQVPVRYRLDKAPLMNEKWSPSADGTSIFADEDSDIVRQLIKGNTFILEVKDFRGQPYRASFDLSGARQALSRVLQQCGVSEMGLDEKVVGLRHEIALDIERWGPKNITTNKNILRALNKYDGPQDAAIDPTFAIAVQRFYDDYIQHCRDKKLSGVFCDSLHIFWKAGVNPVMFPVSSVIYERAPDKLKQEAGKLRISE